MPDNATVEIRFQLHPTPHAGVIGESESMPAVATTGRLPRVTQVLALALHFQEMVRRGEARDYADLARLGGVTRERMSQIMKLVWLAPDIIQEILYLPPVPSGRYPISELAVRRIAQVLSWDEQRRRWRALKNTHCP